MELFSPVLPQAPRLHLETWPLDTTTAQRTLRVPSTQALVPCPVCRCPTRRIHSRDVRTVAELPWAQWRVVLHRQVRQFFCANRRWSRRIFTERLPGVVAPWARRTARLLAWLAQIAVALGGAAGVQLSRGLGVAVRRRTLLRLLRRLPLPAFASPTVLGVDDFALRQRQRYGTILIDLERRQPVALLPEHTAEPLAPWLREHPGGQGLVRDRSPVYAEGARHGAPAAIQVADRVHLLQHLRKALDPVVIAPSHVLDAVHETLRQQPVPLPDGAMAVPVPAHDIPLPAQRHAAQRQARRQALHTQVWALHRQGWTAPAMAQQGGASLRTVQRDRRRAPCAGRKRRRDLGDRVRNPDKAFLLERWKAGCHTAMRWFCERRQRGYGGSDGLVAASARR